MQVLYVAAPEVENRRRSLATKAGMRRAMTEGRYVNVPPKGYKRGRDAQDRYLIVPGPDAGHVREAFRLAAETTRSMESILLDLRKAGFACSKNQFGLMLRNPLYAGRIVIPAWGADAERDVAGVHEPLIKEAVWARVQRERFGRVDCRSQSRRRLVPELPLRGHLLCSRSGVRLTGSRSKSRGGHHVWYYHGQGSGVYRVRADVAHAAFAAHLAGVRMAAPVATLLRALADERGEAGAASRRRTLASARTALDAAERKLLDIDTRFLDGDLDRESRGRLLTHFRKARDAARETVADAALVETDGPEHLRFAVAVLERLPDVWEGATPEARDALAGSMWPSGLVFDGAGYRTASGDDLIRLLVGVRAENGNTRPSKKSGRPFQRPGQDPDRTLATRLAGLYRLRALLGEV